MSATPLMDAIRRDIERELIAMYARDQMAGLVNQVDVYVTKMLPNQRIAPGRAERRKQERAMAKKCKPRKK